MPRKHWTGRGYPPPGACCGLFAPGAFSPSGRAHTPRPRTWLSARHSESSSLRPPGLRRHSPLSSPGSQLSSHAPVHAPFLRVPFVAQVLRPPGHSRWKRGFSYPSNHTTKTPFQKCGFVHLLTHVFAAATSFTADDLAMSTNRALLFIFEGVQNFCFRSAAKIF